MGNPFYAPNDAFQHKRRHQKNPEEIIEFTLEECEMIRNVCFACLEYETSKGILFKKQARAIINKLQPLI